MIGWFVGAARRFAMSLSPGVRLGAYEIVRLIDVGGMGEVYQARDTRLDRVVVVPTSSAADRVSVCKSTWAQEYEILVVSITQHGLLAGRV